MPVHVPFNQRESNRRHYGTIYVGPGATPARRRFNWWGFNGMWMSVLALFTIGVLSPVALIVSLMGLRRPGRKMATIGTVVSLGGIGMLAMLVLVAAHADHHRDRLLNQVKLQRANVEKTVKTKSLLASAYDDVVEYRGAHAGQLPGDIEGNVMIVQYKDLWGHELRYEPEDGFALIRSAGPDGQFLSADDLIRKVTTGNASTDSSNGFAKPIPAGTGDELTVDLDDPNEF